MTLVRTTKPEKPKEKVKVSLTDYRLLLAISLLIPCLFLLAGFGSAFIPSRSMMPALQPGDHILTIKNWLAYPFGARPRRGDIILFQLDNSKIPTTDAPDPKWLPAPTSDLLIKRVVGLPNETIEIEGDDIYINGVKIVEKYTPLPEDPNAKNNYVYAVGKPYQIPPDQYFVMGDNRPASLDSRYWGCVSRGDIAGKFARILYHSEGDAPPAPTQ